VIRMRLTVLCALACAVAVTGCGRQLPPVTRTGASTVTRPASTRPASTAQASTAPLRAPWPERRMLPEAAKLWNASQVLDPTTDVLYALVSTTLASQYGPYVLQAIDLRTGKVRRGESYKVSGLALASGYLWLYGVSGPGGHSVLDEASTGTLATVRSVSMSRVCCWAGVTPGPAGSVWAGWDRTLLRVSVSTGAVLARAALPAGLDLTGLAAGPGGTNMYASAARLRPGGAVVLAYSAAAGRLLARADGAPLTYSAGGADLTAVPGGVWVSFRTGMLGLSGLLTARSLSVISGFPATAATSPAAATSAPASAADSPVTGTGTVDSWPASSSSVYASAASAASGAGGALWVATGSGLVACVNPVTGQVRADEIVRSQQGQPTILLAADSAAHEVIAAITSPGYTGIVAISPPRNCWK